MKNHHQLYFEIIDIFDFETFKIVDPKLKLIELIENQKIEWKKEYHIYWPKIEFKPQTTFYFTNSKGEKEINKRSN